MGRFFRRVGRAFAGAWRAYWHRFSRTMGFLAVELCLYMMCLAPLLFLIGQGMVFLAALCVPMWMLIIWPVRINAAAAMQNCLDGGSLFTPWLIDLSEYGRKLLQGLKQSAYLLLWSIPLIAAGIYAWIHFSGVGGADALTVMRMIRDFGGGKTTSGVLNIALVFIGLLLLVCLGLGFHSGNRHAFVLGRRHMLRHRRFGNLVCWIFAQAVMLLPVWITLGIALSRYLFLLDNINGLLYGSVSLPSTKTTLLILGIGLGVTLPFLPLRSLITAAYVHELKEELPPEILPEKDSGGDAQDALRAEGPETL